MTVTLSKATTDVDFTLLLERPDGKSFSYSRGSSTAMTSYESASTSKLVTAVVILSLVDRGVGGLSLDSKAADLLGWTVPAGNPASQMTLRHLLSFTSGFWDEPAIINSPTATFAQSVQAIYDTNITENTIPGSQFYYASTHLQIAGMMAIWAGGFADWTAVFNDFKSRTGLFAHSVYDLPSTTNPRLAGGMHWTAEDYLAFLRALYKGQILSSTMSAELWASQRGTGTVTYSPVLDKLGEDWAYAFGNWVECPSANFDASATTGRNSSPGAYGAYPFIDFRRGYFGILARQGALGTFPNGVNLFRTVQDTAAQWAVAPSN
ncbi:MAG TPA: serine hydrolase domain-containing protein [Rectinemataceae bacterium]|nr:serine hydrolase domain-containing protein [Rectinemataceae bacterium]